MARARNIKPGFFKNEELVELPFETRLLFIGLWTVADREGRMEDRPKRIKMEVFPADDVDVDRCLNQLQAHGFILRYSVENARYIQVLNFSRHQRPHAKEQASTIPAPGEPQPQNDETTTKGGANHNLGSDMSSPASLYARPDTLNTDTPFSESPLSEPLTPGASAPVAANAPIACDEPPPNPKPSRYPDHFETFWKAYPSGHGVKKQAAEQWAKIPASERQAVMEALDGWKASDRWQRGFVKDAQRWLRDRQWQDEPPPPPATSNALTVVNATPNPNKRGGYTAGELIQMAREEYARESS